MGFGNDGLGIVRWVDVILQMDAKTSEDVDQVGLFRHLIPCTPTIIGD